MLVLPLGLPFHFPLLYFVPRIYIVLIVSASRGKNVLQLEVLANRMSWNFHVTVIRNIWWCLVFVKNLFSRLRITKFLAQTGTQGWTECFLSQEKVLSWCHDFFFFLTIPGSTLLVYAWNWLLILLCHGHRASCNPSTFLRLLNY